MFVCADSGDVITDFVSGIDSLWLDTNVFAALTPAALDASQLRDIATTPDGNDCLVFDGTNGALYYDGSGNGLDLQAIANLGAGSALLASDVLVI